MRNDEEAEAEVGEVRKDYSRTHEHDEWISQGNLSLDLHCSVDRKHFTSRTNTHAHVDEVSLTYGQAWKVNMHAATKNAACQINLSRGRNGLIHATLNIAVPIMQCGSGSIAQKDRAQPHNYVTLATLILIHSAYCPSNYKLTCTLLIREESKNIQPLK